MGEGAQLIEGAVLGALFQELLKNIVEMMEKARKSKTFQRILRATLKELTPLVEEIKQYNEDLDLPREEIETLIKEKEAGEEAVRRCPKFPYLKSLGGRNYQDKLGEGHNSIVNCLSFNMQKQTEMARDVEMTLNQVRDILEKLSNENYGQGMMCWPPQNPEFVVGMDEPLARLKMELLKDGASILGLTGMPGSGKTTLARKLCWDDHVKGKFGEHILFVTFSKTPNLKIIVQALFQRSGCWVPEFHSDEDAVKGLGLLLKQIGESPILLVLDDVWPGSESLVDNFKFQMPDYKILITSRIAFPRVDPQIQLEPLCYEDALTLFRHFALLKDNSPYVPDEYIVQEVVRGCRGSPLALKVIGRSLCQQPFEVWQKMVEEWSLGHSILDSNNYLLTFLQKSLDVLEEKSIIKECFMDLGLFPEDQRIPVAALIDMWAELYKLDDDGRETMAIINKLASRNLANVLITRKVASDADNYYNNHFIMMHDLLRELAIYQSSHEPFKQRKRLMIDVHENNRQWCLEKKQQGIIACILSKFLKWCVEQKQQRFLVRTLSISSDETFTSDWRNTQPAETEVLILNVRTKQYSLPDFTKKMNKLKVLIFTNYSFHPSELKNFELLGSLSNLKRIRLEKVSVPSLGKLKNLRKLSLYMCNTSQAFESCTIPISDALPNLEFLNIDYCKDMVELPTGLCDISPLKKLSVSNCHKFSTLPQEIGKLENLELLRLNSCSDLVGIPDSIGRLSKLSFLDISDCISLRKLPEDIGNLYNLKKVYMTGCSRCELPVSVTNLEHLKDVTCDEETAASWEIFKPMLPNLRIEVPQVDVNLNWLLGTSSQNMV